MQNCMFLYSFMCFICYIFVDSRLCILVCSLLYVDVFCKYHIKLYGYPFAVFIHSGGMNIENFQNRGGRIFWGPALFSHKYGKGRKIVVGEAWSGDDGDFSKDVQGHGNNRRAD